MEHAKWKKENENESQLVDTCLLNELSSGQFLPRSVICDNMGGFGIINPQTGLCSGHRADMSERSRKDLTNAQQTGWDPSRVQFIQQQGESASSLQVCLPIPFHRRTTGRIPTNTRTPRVPLWSCLRVTPC